MPQSYERPGTAEQWEKDLIKKFQEKGCVRRGGTKTDFVRNKLWEAKERDEREKIGVTHD